MERDQPSGVLDPGSPLARFCERQRDGVGMRVERSLEVVLGEAKERRDEPDGVRAIGQIPHRGRLLAHPVRAFGRVDAAERAHATGFGHRGSQGPTTVHRHRCGHHRVSQAEHLGETRLDHARS
jgi:hypothetical protein